MGRRYRHPLKSFVMFILLVAGAYYGYENRHLFKGEVEEVLSGDQRDELRADVVARWQDHPDFVTVRAMSWRPNERRYRLEVSVQDAIESPKPLCQEIAEFVRAQYEVDATVLAIDSSGRELCRVVQ
jgi:hypothetical protein